MICDNVTLVRPVSVPCSTEGEKFENDGKDNSLTLATGLWSRVHTKKYKVLSAHHHELILLNKGASYIAVLSANQNGCT